MRKWIITVLIIWIMLTAGTSHALRWGTDIINPGEYAAVILQKCGEPQNRTIVRGETKNALRIEQWVYEKGDGYYYIFIFRGGVLKKIEAVRKP